MIFGQVPSPEGVLQAASANGWASALLTFIILSILGSFGYLMKKILDDTRVREERTENRITALELEIRTELFVQIKVSSEVIMKVVSTMEHLCTLTESMTSLIKHLEDTMLIRPCLLNVAQQGMFLKELDELCRRHMTEYPPSLSEVK